MRRMMTIKLMEMITMAVAVLKIMMVKESPSKISSKAMAIAIFH